MIDIIALCVAHGVLALGFMRITMREGLEDDPLLSGIESASRAKRDARRKAREAARRAKSGAR